MPRDPAPGHSRFSRARPHGRDDVVARHGSARGGHDDARAAHKVNEQRGHDMPMKFSQFIASHAGGLADDEATDELRAVMEACAQEKKNGKITVVLDVRPEGDAFVIALDVTAKSPRAAAVGRLYWTDLDGYPTQRNPIQPSLDDALAERGQG